MDNISGPNIWTSFELFGIEFTVTQTHLTTWLIGIVLVGGSILLTRKLSIVPNKKQTILEMFIEAIYSLVDTTMGKKFRSFAPYIGTLALFLAFANLSGLVGLRPPTADLNTTIALSMMTFFIVHISGIKSKGIGKYLKSFTEPFPLLLPLNIIGELANPISLGFRLFGNVLGGLIIMGLLYGALGAIAVVPIPAIFHAYFDIFSGLIQTFIFIMLTMVFISMAAD